MLLLHNIPLNDKCWLTALFQIDFAFQPIVNIHTGVCYGCEALLRNYKAAGFESIDDFFDQAYNDKILYHIELALREKAIQKFSQLEWKRQAKLFINIDNRVLDSEGYTSGNTINILKYYGLSLDAVCFEISEKHELRNAKEATEILNLYRSQGFKIAVDDCGTGFSGLKLLYYTKPDFIKIDRFFIQEITNDPNKRLFVSSIVNIAHLMGSIVIAEGVETIQEYYSCQDIGCDLIQGYLVQYPEQELGKIQRYYDHIKELNEKNRRKDNSGDKKLIDVEMEYIEPVFNYNSVSDLFENFKAKKNRTFFPVINNNYEPLGIISEKSLKDYAYSLYGSAMVQNPAFGKNLNKFITKYPIADIRTPVEKILEIYSHNENLEGIIIVDGMKYKGFLSAYSLLKVLNEKNIAIARDQNPLTKMPGNTLIHKYLSESLQDTETPYVFVYFDLDNFKPYNDKYGFRNGDRVILLFSELLKAQNQSPERFAGHIGGDDFFMGVKGISADKIYPDIMQIAKQFQNDVESFYDTEAIEKGYIVAKDRQGRKTVFPPLTVSSVILEIPAPRDRIYSTEEISTLIAGKKKIAKDSAEKICVTKLGDNEYNEDEDDTASSIPSIRRSGELFSNFVLPSYNRMKTDFQSI